MKDLAKLFLTIYLLGHSNDPNVGVSKIDPLVEKINKVRKENNLEPLIQKEKLSKSAASKAKDMTNKDYWSHLNPNGKTPWEFIEESDYEYKNAGENLAKNFTNNDEMIQAWMNSPTHREILLSKLYKEMGTGSDGKNTVLHVGTQKYKKPTILDFLMGKLK